MIHAWGLVSLDDTCMGLVSLDDTCMGTSEP